VSDLHPAGMDVKVLTGDQRRAREILQRLVPTGSLRDDGEYLIAAAADDVVPEMVRRLVAEGIDVKAVVPSVEQGLEDMFLELTSREESR
jgi:hypothetical protein